MWAVVPPARHRQDRAFRVKTGSSICSGTRSPGQIDGTCLCVPRRPHCSSGYSVWLAHRHGGRQSLHGPSLRIYDAGVDGHLAGGGIPGYCWQAAYPSLRFVGTGNEKYDGRFTIKGNGGNTSTRIGQTTYCNR